MMFGVRAGASATEGFQCIPRWHFEPTACCQTERMHCHAKPVSHLIIKCVCTFGSAI